MGENYCFSNICQLFSFLAKHIFLKDSWNRTLYLLDVIRFWLTFGLFHYEKLPSYKRLSWGRMAGPSRNQLIISCGSILPCKLYKIYIIWTVKLLRLDHKMIPKQRHTCWPAFLVISYSNCALYLLYIWPYKWRGLFQHSTILRWADRNSQNKHIIEIENVQTK